MEQNYHRLLRRQLKKYLPQHINANDLNDFLDAVNSAYIGFDTDIQQAENTLEQSSIELFRANEELRKNVQRKTAEAEELSSRIESIVNSVKEIIFQTDIEGKWTYLNPAWETITGFTVEESIGQHFKHFVLREDFEVSKAYLSELINKQGDTSRYTLRYVTKNGEIRWVEAFVNLNLDANGNLIGSSGTLNDVTERINAQNELTRLALVAEKTDNVVIVSDAAGRINWVNNAFEKLTEYSHEEVLGKKPGDFLQGVNTNPETVKQISAALKQGESYLGEIYNYTKSGNGYWLSLSITPIKDENQKLKGFIAIELDITERKKAEVKLMEYAEDLEKINGELDKFAYVVSHDLKAPLRAINNLSEWIEEDLEEIMPPENKEQMTLLRGRVGRMENLINGILQYSRAGRAKVALKQIDTKKMVEFLVQQLRPSADYDVRYKGDFPTLLTEEVALEQVFSNFISNAFKYNNSSEPYVEITSSITNNWVQFCIADNGSGIEESFFEKVFVIFQTLQARDTVESTGVGLAIVKKIVEEKGGRTWVESQLNEGTQFYFTWPLNEKE